MNIKHVGEMTVGELKELLEKYDDDFQIVVTITSEDVTYGYSLHNRIGEGGLPSRIVELRTKEQMMR